MNKTAKCVLIIAAIVLLALAGWIAAGPYMAIHGIRQAVESQDIRALERHVDYPKLRANIKAQIEDRIAREIGQRFGTQVTGSAASSVAGMLSASRRSIRASRPRRGSRRARSVSASSTIAPPTASAPIMPAGSAP